MKIVHYSILGVFLAFFLFACSNEQTSESDSKTKLEVDKNSEKYIISEAKKRLNLSENDKIELSFHRAYLNADTSLDAYVVINLKGKVENDYTNNKNPATFSEMGYIGKYNYIIPFNGQTKEVGSPYLIGSNGKESLEVIELGLLSPGYKTLQVNYRVRNAGFAIFLQLGSKKLNPIFEYKRFDNIGTDSTVALFCEIVENPKSIEKDINIYEGKILNYNIKKAFDDPNYYKVEIEKTPKLVRNFFYNPSMQAYAALN